jgi:2-dehydropantoate 2-reductase
MKIAVMGAGALGCYFGARLSEAGHEVWFIARGAHLEAMRRDGLRIESPKGDLHLRDVHATDDPGAVGPADVVLLCVKNRDVESAAAAAAPLVGPETFFVTVQNGVTAPDRLAAIVGRGRVVPGVVRTPGDIRAPGVVRHSAPADVITFGEPDGGGSARSTALCEALRAAGTSPSVSESIRHELWSKFCVQSALASLTTLTDLDIGPLLGTPASARLFEDAITEAWTVGRSVVPDLPDDIVEKNWAFLHGLPPHMHASMLDDRRRGKPLENDYLSGDVVRLGAEYGVPTPIHSVLYAVLKPIADQLEPVE